MFRFSEVLTTETLQEGENGHFHWVPVSDMQNEKAMEKQPQQCNHAKHQKWRV